MFFWIFGHELPCHRHCLDMLPFFSPSSVLLLCLQIVTMLSRPSLTGREKGRSSSVMSLPPVIAAIRFSSIFLSVSSRSSTKLGVVREWKTTLLWRPLVKKWNTFCGEMFACFDNLSTIWLYSLCVSFPNLSPADSDPISEPRTRRPLTISTSSFFFSWLHVFDFCNDVTLRAFSIVRGSL